MKIQKFLFLLLAFSFIIPSFPGYCATLPGQDSYASPVYLNSPLPSKQVIHAAFGVVNGKDYMYTSTSGTPAILNVYNLDDQVLVASHELAGTKNIWNHIVDSNGIVYIASSGLFFKYNPYTNTLKSYGKILQSESETFVTTIDENNNIYIGTFPNGKVIKYVQSTDSFIDLGQVTDGAVYVRSISYCNGYVYCGVKGDSLVGFYRVNVNNPSDKTLLEFPENPTYYDKNDFEWVYSTTAVNNKIILYTKTSKTSPLLLYDTTTQEFADTGYKGSFQGLYASPARDDKCYFTYGSKLFAINLITNKVEDLNFNLGVTTTTHAIGWVTLEGNADFPGESLITIDVDNGRPTFYNIANKKILKWNSINLTGGHFAIQSIESGDAINGDRSIYISAYAGNVGARYDLDTKTITNLDMGQAEGMVGYLGKQYFGIYTRAYLYVSDFKDTVTSITPAKIAQIGSNQDRPFAMAAGDGKVFSGTVPDYGVLGGSLGIYDVVNKSIESFDNLIENQSIISIAYRDGRIYGSTSIWGGLGATPVAEQAKMFIFDVATKQKIKEFTPTITGVSNPTWIGSVAFDQNGILWGVTGNTLFSYDPLTDQVLNSITFADYTYSTTSHQWRPTYIRFDEYGLLYTNIKGIKVVNTKTLEYLDLYSKIGSNVALFTIGCDGNIYYDNYGKLFMIQVQHNLILPDQISSYNVFVPQDYSKAISHEGKVIAYPYFASFATVIELFGYEIEEYGVLFSSSNPSPTIEQDIKAQAKSNKNASGQYGILFYGAGIHKGTTYYSRAYAIYKDINGNKSVVYGEAKTFTTPKY